MSKQTKAVRNSAEILDEIKSHPLEYRRARQVAIMRCNRRMASPA
jgi:hypothetical protein